MPNELKKKAFESGEFLDETLFVQALSLCALRSKAFEKEKTGVEKILHFIEKILQSPGIVKIKKMVGKTRISAEDMVPLAELKELYKDCFKASNGSCNCDQELNEFFEPK